MSSNLTRTALFIDGASLLAAARTLGGHIDFRRLLSEFESGGPVIRAFCYSEIVEGHDYPTDGSVLSWLGYNGYTVVSKPTRELVDASGRRMLKGSIGVELAVDAMQLTEFIDHMVLFSGNDDFRPLVRAIQRRGVRVTVVSTIPTEPAMIVEGLRRQADVFIELAQLMPAIGRETAQWVIPREYRRSRAPLKRHPRMGEVFGGEKSVK